MKKDKENKTSNLAIYERNLKRNYALKGGIVGDVINTTYRFVETWPIAISLGTAITTMSIFTGLNHAKEKINQRKK